MKKEIKIMKCIVETSGDFGLMNGKDEHIRHDRPSVTVNSGFVESRILNGDLKLLARGLPREASDAEFADFVKESKDKDKGKDIDKAHKLAVAAYCAHYGVNVEGEEIETEVETKAQKKAREAKEKEAKEKEDKQKADVDELLSLFGTGNVGITPEDTYTIYSADNSGTVIAEGTLDELKALKADLDKKAEDDAAAAKAAEENKE